MGSRNHFVSLLMETSRAGSMNVSNLAIKRGWQVTSCCLLQLWSEPPRSCECSPHPSPHPTLGPSLHPPPRHRETV